MDDPPIKMTGHAERRVHERLAECFKGGYEEGRDWVIDVVRDAERRNAYSRRPPKWAAPMHYAWDKSHNEWRKRVRYGADAVFRWVKTTDPQSAILVAKKASRLVIVTVITPEITEQGVGIDKGRVARGRQ